MSPGMTKTTSTKSVGRLGGFLYRVARRRVAQFVLVIGVAGAMVVTSTSMGVTTASASSKAAASHTGGRYGCQFNWGGRHHRNSYRDCTETLTGTVTAVGTNNFTVQRGISAPSSTITTTTPAAANCSASTSGETQLDESSFLASTNTASSTTDAPQNAINNAVNDNTAAGRFSSDEDQAVGDTYIVNMGTAQTFNEVEMAVPNSSTDYATGYDVNVSTNGSTWTTVATCTGSGTPEIASFPTQTAQYVEIALTAADTSYYWSIDQFFVYNTTPAATTTTTTEPVTSGLLTVDVARGTRYTEPCTTRPGFGDIATGDIVTVSGYRAGTGIIDATSVTIKAPSGTSWSSNNCPREGYRHGRGYGGSTTTTTTAVPTTGTTGWGGGYGRGHGHHGR